MNARVVAFAFAALLLTPATASSRSLDWLLPFDNDATASKQIVAPGPVSGYIKYRALYERASQQPLVISVELATPARLFCMGVEDFEFNLTDQNGKRFVNSPDITGQGRPVLMVVRIPPRADASNPRPCVYGPVTRALFPLAIDELYPSLAPGHYHLTITFNPTDKSAPAAIFPAIDFTVC